MTGSPPSAVAPISRTPIVKAGIWPRVVVRGVLLALLGLLATAASAAEPRVALVIGNARYEDRPLTNPVNDAQDLAAALTAAGFKVTLKTNLGADAMKEAISEFGDALKRDNGTGLFYFSGHGVQTPKGNYLLPVGRAFKREKDVELFAVEARSVLTEMQQARNPLNILILDACRDSPLPSADKSVGSKGLARMDAPSGSVIAFATAPGKTASDNATGRNGLYTKHLISAINTPGLRLEDVFKRVGAAVEKESSQHNGDQSPEEVMKLRSELPFYFKSKVDAGTQLATIEPEPVIPVVPAPAPPDPTTGTIEGFQILAGGAEVKDRKTGLIWQRCSVGQRWEGGACAGSAKIFNFPDAAKLVGNGWRVPTKDELASLVVQRSGNQPTINQASFPATPPSPFWTSTPHAQYGGYAWFVNFYNGDVDSGLVNSYIFFVRLVRE